MLFGKLKDGTPVMIHEIHNGQYSAGLCDLGAGISFFNGPDRNEKQENVVLRFKTPQELLLSTAYFGLTVGRYANRIAKGRFVLDGKNYQLALNNGANHLHGGPTGLSFCMWKAEKLQCDGDPGIRFSIHDTDGHENYPGNLDAEVTYVLRSDGSLVMNYHAVCDAPCPVNFVNHSYFNLAGESSGKDVLGTELQLACSRYVPVGADLIPTGEIKPVAGTPFDFTSVKTIGRDFKAAGGYDHCFMLDETESGRINPVAFASCPSSGRTLKVFSNMPAVQFYTGNFLHCEPFYSDHMGFCLETEFCPDSPNHKNFPDCILRPGMVYDRTTVYQLGTEK
ncbi:MAG: galactose mutarotase [Sphaerochaetaceae bacterium]|jgi:aldose 1-epimerase|nr:galactose mutarotase [Sphaerochaetaceae bacterium]MDD3163239.1 galactose mutarotase [Sphaerochaetaceae bacterium]MDD4007722.1 galactose mutarotase [Sphaerochaetaceae bacterium]